VRLTPGFPILRFDDAREHELRGSNEEVGMIMMNSKILTPVQQLAVDGLLKRIPAGDVFVLRSASGMGRTTVLENVHAALGGALVGVRNFMDILNGREPAPVEEAFLDTVEQSLASHDLVIVDDLHLVTSVVQGCENPRSFLMDAALTAILGEAGVRQKKLVFAADNDDAPWPVRRRAYAFTVDEFGAADYECICRAYLVPETADKLDYARIHRFAPMLNAHQLKNACGRFQREGSVDTDRVLEYLRSHHMPSDVEINEVQPVV